MRKPKNKGTSISPSIQVFKPQALKREISVPSQKNWQEDTILYGKDDALPLRIAQAVDESPAANSCVSTVAQFIKGAGFTNKELEKIKIDENGTTLWELHCALSDSLALFWGFAVNHKYNDDSKITNAYPMSFESIRFTKPEGNSPYITEIKYNPYFGTEEFRKEFTKAYPIHKVERVSKDYKEYKAKYEEEFPGQVYYYGMTSPLYRFYPVPRYWSAEEAILSDHKLQEFHNEELENGFFQSVLINAVGNPSEWSKNPRLQETYTKDDGTKGKRASKTVGEEFNDQMSESFSGSKKAGTAMVMWSLNSDTAVKIQPFPSGINGDRIISTQDSITKTITIAFQVPSILANISEGVSLGSGGSEIQKAVELMQSRTLEQRTILQNYYNTVLLPNLQIPISVPVEIKNFNPVTVPVEIDDKVWSILSDSEKRNLVKSSYNNIKLEDSVQSKSSRTLIEVIGVGGSQALLAILTQFAEGKLTQAQASNTLQILFGIDKAQAMMMLNKEEIDSSNPLPESEPLKVNESLKSLNIQQIERLQKIVKKFNRSQVDPNDPKGLTYQQAEQILLSYGLTKDEISAWLITNEEE